MNDPPPRTKLQRLFAFPFTPLETEMFIEYLTTTQKDNGFAKDVLLMWNIQIARFGDVRQMILMEGGNQADEKRRIIKEGLEKAKLSI